MLSTVKQNILERGEIIKNKKPEVSEKKKLVKKDVTNKQVLDLLMSTKKPNKNQTLALEANISSNTNQSIAECIKRTSTTPSDNELYNDIPENEGHIKILKHDMDWTTDNDWGESSDENDNTTMYDECYEDKVRQIYENQQQINQDENAEYMDCCAVIRPSYSASLLNVRANVEGRPLKMLLDSGAQMSIIPSRFFHDLRRRKNKAARRRTQLKPAAIRIVYGDGSGKKIQGISKLRFSIGKKSFESDFVVVNGGLAILGKCYYRSIRGIKKKNESKFSERFPKGLL